jgi:cytochrome P450
MARGRVDGGAIRSAVLTPAVLTFVASARVRQRPHRPLQLLQRLDPVHRSPLGVVVVSRHRDVGAILRDASFGSDESKADGDLLRVPFIDKFLSGPPKTDDRPAFLELFDLLMLFRDPPDHTRLRTLVGKAFTPRRIEELTDRVADLVEELLEPARARRAMDLMHDFAYPFPARVICELLGIPDDDVALFVRCAPALAIALDPSPMRTAEGIRAADAATAELRAYLEGLIEQRRRTPGTDLLSGLIAAESDGDRLSEDELIATVLLLIIAGHETTANVIGNSMHRLAKSEALQAALARADDEQLRNAVEELLRLDGPVQMAERIALTPHTIGDVELAAGQIVILMIGAANRDPHAFAHPQQVDLHRAKNPHLAFGAGAHFCIGAPLARLELRLALRALSRLPGQVQLAGKPKHRASFTIRGLEQLNVRW